MNKLDADYSGRTQSSEMLERRLRVNAAQSQGDFLGWQKEHFPVRPGDRVLDVGCGTGAQLKIIDELTQGKFTALAMDASTESVQKVREHFNRGDIEALVYDMDRFNDLAQERSLKQSFDFAQSSYAIYYAKDPISVLREMLDCLKPSGVLSVTVPTQPHEMLNFVSSVYQVPQKIHDTVNFSTEYLLPFAEQELDDMRTAKFQSTLSFASVDEFISMWEATTYYDPQHKDRLLSALGSELGKNGKLSFKKNSLMITGRKPNV